MTTIPDNPTPKDTSITPAPLPISAASSENAVTTVVVKAIQKPQQTVGTPLSTKSVQPIYVSKIANKDNLKIIQNQLKNWHKIAQKNYLEVKNDKTLPKEQIGKVADNLSMIQGLISSICEVTDTDAVFVAFDKNGNLQAVAIADFDPDEYTRVDYIATHPENIPIGDKSAHFQGSGAAVMSGIMGATLLLGMGSKYLTLQAYPLAIGFYEHMGLKTLPKVSPSHTFTPMVIMPDGMEQTLKSRRDNLIYMPEPENLPQSDTSLEDRAL